MKRREMLEAIGLGVSALALVNCQGSGEPRTQIQALPKTSSTTPKGPEANKDEGVKSDDAKAVENNLPAKDENLDQAEQTQVEAPKTADVIDVDKLVSQTVYSKNAPGKWAGKEASHAPDLSITENKLKISTPHVMCRDHYIMMYQVRNKKGTILSEHVFAQPPVSATLTALSPTLPPTVIDLTPFNLAKGEELRVYSLCNQHGYWVGTISIT